MYRIYFPTKKKKSKLCPEVHKNANEAYYALLPLIKGQSVFKSVFRAEKIKIYKTLIRPAESWTLHKDIAKELAALKLN